MTLDSSFLSHRHSLRCWRWPAVRDEEQLEKRLAKLVGGVALIKAGNAKKFPWPSRLVINHHCVFFWSVTLLAGLPQRKTNDVPSSDPLKFYSTWSCILSGVSSGILCRYLLVVYLANLLSGILSCPFYLAYLPAFYLVYILAFYLAYILAFYVAFFLAYILAFYVAFYVAYILAV